MLLAAVRVGALLAAQEPDAADVRVHHWHGLAQPHHPHWASIVISINELTGNATLMFFSVLGIFTFDLCEAQHHTLLLGPHVHHHVHDLLRVPLGRYPKQPRVRCLADIKKDFLPLLQLVLKKSTFPQLFFRDKLVPTLICKIHVKYANHIYWHYRVACVVDL